MYCAVELVRHSAPRSWNNDLLNGGVILEMYHRVIDMAIETSFKFHFTKIQTPRYFFLRARSKMVGDMDERIGMDA